MVDPDSVQQDFQHRLKEIAPQGMGLSVDVYSPDLFELMNKLREQGLQPGYLEVFKASTTALTAVRQAVPDMPLAYHGEGLWITQPDVQESPFFQQDVGEMVTQLNSIQSLWLNHECAMKQIAGYSFGTYVPPLYTRLSAEVVAANIVTVQQAMDRQGRRGGGTAPLFLLEMPPLTYFSAGTIPIPHFFRLVTALVPCGLVLDIGHLWTVYRYTGACRRTSLERFVREFLDEFPLERVVEIHVAGLACHESVGEPEGGEGLPEWIDAHAAPIPSILFTLLEQVLAHSNLVSLRAVALEVDTKPIEMIVEEYAEAVRRFSLLVQQTMARGAAVEQLMGLAPRPASVPEPVCQSDRQQLLDDYARYAQIISGQVPMTGPEWREVAVEATGVARYRTSYMPHEILHWGGDLAEMFPQTCRTLAERGICLTEFVTFWFRSPRPITHSYDFFLLKIERFLEFVTERAPDVRGCVQQECDILRQGYAQANEVVGTGNGTGTSTMSFWQSLTRPIIGMAPMDGVTDATFRHTVAMYGKPDVSFTEFTHVHDVCRGPEFLLDSLIYHEAERPIVAQLYGKEPDLFYQAAHAVCELGFDGLDINMGCPSRSVASSGSGAGLIRTPDVAQAIMQAARQGIVDWAAGQTLEGAGLKPGRVAAILRMNEQRRNARSLVRRTIPLSVKTRLGYDVVVVDRWIERLLLEQPAVISLHGRTLQQMYRGEADWNAIARAAEIVRGSGTLLFGNGDLHSYHDVVRRVRDTGVDGVLVGRAALGAPWFFRQKEAARLVLQQHRPEEELEPWMPPLDIRFEMLFDHARRFEAACGQGQFRRMRKHLGWYCKGFPHAASLRAAMFRVSSVADLEQVLADFHAHCASLTEVPDQMLLDPLVATGPSPTL